MLHRLTRRGFVLGGAAALAARPAFAATRLHLRLLETSDLHMFVADFDYYRDRQDLSVGLCRVASLIQAARGEASNSLLFDNGDTIQGNPLADHIAAGPLNAGQPHPMYRTMSLLGYDAATLGNHEFNYGLDFLERALEFARFPFACANVLRANGAAFLPSTTVLERPLRAEDGSEHSLRIGVIGFAPPQIMVWDRGHLLGRVEAPGIVETAARLVPGLRAQCDIVVALCHSGLGSAAPGAAAENAALALAGVPDIDAIFTGHSHRVFPGPDYANQPGIDHVGGRLGTVPAVMPGFWGSHLGVIDLTLEQGSTGWRVVAAESQARPIYRRDGAKVVPLVEARADILAEIQQEHAETRVWVNRPVGSVDRPISTRFALLGDVSVMDVINAAQLWYAGALLAATPHAGLPLLSAAAPFKAGFTPDDFVNLPAGQLSVRDIAEIYVFPNTVAAVRITGATLAAWLEKSAGIFNRLDPDAAGPQELIDHRMPAYNFDVISGLSWEIDLTQPRRFGPQGDAGTGRVRNLLHARMPVDPKAEFVVVTNNYRADGGGSFPGLDGSNVVLRAPDPNRDAMTRFFETMGAVLLSRLSDWRFASFGKPVQVIFDTAPETTDAPAGLPPMQRQGVAPRGFARFLVEL